MLPVGRVGKVPHLFGVSYIRDPAVDPQAAGFPAQRPTRRADLPHKSTRLPSRPSRPGLDDSCADSTARDGHDRNPISERNGPCSSETATGRLRSSTECADRERSGQRDTGSSGVRAGDGFKVSGSGCLFSSLDEAARGDCSPRHWLSQHIGSWSSISTSLSRSGRAFGNRSASCPRAAPAADRLVCCVPASRA